MKNNVIGSRQTMMNSLNRIAPRPRKGTCLSKGWQTIQTPKKLKSSNSNLVAAYLKIGVWKSAFFFFHAVFCSVACFSLKVTKTSSSDGPIS